MQYGINRKVRSTAYVDDIKTHHNVKSNKCIDKITYMLGHYNRSKVIQANPSVV
jgi:hypothetical protein